MLSAFPQLLFLAPLAIALLRVAAGITIVLTAWQTAERRDAMARTRAPLIGHAPAWLIWLAASTFALIGALILLGAWTQVAACLAALGALKLLILSRTHPAFTTLPTSTYALLLAITIALIGTGAGAFAFDLPL